jgi:hypothetical protein
MLKVKLIDKSCKFWFRAVITNFFSVYNLPELERKQYCTPIGRLSYEKMLKIKYVFMFMPCQRYVNIVKKFL